MITQGELKYQVLGNKEEGHCIWLRDVNRHFFDAFPAKSSMHLDDDTNEYYHIKVVKHRGTEIWLTCHEDENGNRYGVLDPESLPTLPAPDAVDSAASTSIIYALAESASEGKA